MSEANDNARLETLSDGVFAIAMTLLVLEIKVPELSSVHSRTELWRELGHAWPSYLAFCLSFTVIFVLWVSHHSGFKMIDKSSPHFTYANGFLLLVVAFLPFPTALLSTYVATEYARPAIVVYCFACALNNFAWVMVGEAQLRPQRLLKSTTDLDVILTGRKLGFAALGFSLVVTLLAFWAPYVALTANALFWAAAVYISVWFPARHTSSRTEPPTC